MFLYIDLSSLLAFFLFSASAFVFLICILGLLALFGAVCCNDLPFFFLLLLHTVPIFVRVSPVRNPPSCLFLRSAFSSLQSIIHVN